MTTSKRQHTISRTTKETSVKLSLDIDGQGKSKIKTGIGFFDHMLDLFTNHGLFNLDVEVNGDLHVDFHHSVEDVGICLGIAFKEALADYKGINRFANVCVPMDEALCECAIDICNRPFLGFEHSLEKEKVGNFDTELVEEFLNAFVNNARVCLHISIVKGTNTHHKIESVFKALGQCLDKATQIDPRKTNVPSTKGIL